MSDNEIFDEISKAVKATEMELGGKKTGTNAKVEDEEPEEDEQFEKSLAQANKHIEKCGYTDPTEVKKALKLKGFTKNVRKAAMKNWQGNAPSIKKSYDENLFDNVEEIPQEEAIDVTDFLMDLQKTLKKGFKAEETEIETLKKSLATLASGLHYCMTSLSKITGQPVQKGFNSKPIQKSFAQPVEVEVSSDLATMDEIKKGFEVCIFEADNEAKKQALIDLNAKFVSRNGDTRFEGFSNIKPLLEAKIGKKI